MLTSAQQTILVSAIRAESDSTVVTALENRDDTILANWYNQAGTKIGWKSAVTEDEIMQNGFDWTQVDNLTVGKARIWDWMFNNQQRAINPSKANIRAGIDEAWKGTAAMLAVRAAVYVHCKRVATKAEALFATGTGTMESPALLGWQGTLTPLDIAYAFNANP
jgi:hypothetical protein